MKFKTNKNRVGPDLGGAMTDISFLLIIFFLVTAVFVSEEGLYSYLPEDDTSPQQVESNKVLQIHLAPDEIVVNTNVFDNIDDAIKYITTLTDAINTTQFVAIISVAEGIIYQEVVTMISELKGLKVSEITMASGSQNNFTSKAIPLYIHDEGEAQDFQTEEDM